MVIQSALRLAKALDNYGNPISLLVQRALKREIVTVVDRKTGVRCLSKIGAHRMFGETFHNGDYTYPQIPIRPGDVVIDVGANQGFFATFVAHQGATVHAFEPAKDNYELLLKNIELNGAGAKILPKPCAMGATNGELELICTDMLGGGMNTTSPDFAEKMNLPIVDRYRVPCVTFAKAMRDLGVQAVRVFKLDCEGAELDILRSVEPAWRERIDLVALEYHSAAYPLEELVNVLMSWGTHQISFGQSNILFAASNRELTRSLV